MPLCLQHQSIVSELHTLREGGVDIFVFTQLMADMRKPGLRDLQKADLVDSLTEREMAHVLFVTQRIENDLLAAADLFPLGIFDTIGVRDIGKITEAETQHGHL